MHKVCWIIEQLNSRSGGQARRAASEMRGLCGSVPDSEIARSTMSWQHNGSTRGKDAEKNALISSENQDAVFATPITPHRTRDYSFLFFFSPFFSSFGVIN